MKSGHRYGAGLCNVFQDAHSPIRHGFSTYGYFPDRDNRVFGEYICSITRALGGVDRATHELLYCPTVPGTRLQYLDLRQPPDLVEVDYIGHVGRDEMGYHIVFVS